MSLRRLEPGRLAGRGRFGLTAGRLLRVLPQQLVGLLGVWQFFTQAPTPVTSDSIGGNGEPLSSVYPAATCRQLSSDQSAALAECATEHGVTVNDLLARDLFLALWNWKSRHFPGGERDWLQLSIPISLRTAADRHLPAANVVSMAFLARRPPDSADPQQLLRSIHEQMVQIKELRLGLTFVWSLHAVRWLPGGIARMANERHCSATGVLTNLGNAFRRTPLPRRNGRLVVGEAVLERVEALAPLRPHTYIALSVINYAGRVCLTLHYDPRVIQADQAEDLMETYVRRLEASVPVTANCPRSLRAAS